MLEFIRQYKIVFALYNFFHRKELKHNELVYQKLGLAKKYYSSISSKDFKQFENTNTDNIQVDPAKISNSSLFKTLQEADKQSLLDYNKNGFAVLNAYLSAEKVEEINAEIEMLMGNKTIAITNKNKLMFAIHHSALLSNIGNDKGLKELLSVLIDGEAVLFQSINFLTGSEQHTHSDSIHMTTYPLGGLLGVWIALEDITEENGPLHYYPGSHRLPYYLNADYQNEGSTWKLGSKSYSEYEDMVAKKIKENGIQKTKFLAKKGDLLIWHANLFHGGEPHQNKLHSRKSMVYHYFKAGSVCYHEITQRPALIKKIS